MQDVILLDIDGTMVGNVMYQVCHYDIINGVNAGLMEKFKRKLKRDLRSGLMHPDLKPFLMANKDRYQFFVYTASEDLWARILVDCMEQVLGFKFNRPLFTRNDCHAGTFTKSIDLVQPRIHKHLAGKKIVVRDIFIIDNNKTLSEKKHLLILCPTYHQHVVSDVLRFLKPADVQRNLPFIAATLVSYRMLPKSVNPASIKYADMITMYNRFFDKVLLDTLYKIDDNNCWLVMKNKFKCANGDNLNVKDLNKSF